MYIKNLTIVYNSVVSANFVISIVDTHSQTFTLTPSDFSKEKTPSTTTYICLYDFTGEDLLDATFTITEDGYQTKTFILSSSDSDITIEMEEIVLITCTRDSTKDVIGHASQIDNNTLYNITDDTTGGTVIADINQILTDLNNKADTDMVNVTASRNFFSGYDFTVSQESISASQVYTLDLPKTIDPTKYFVNAYAQIKTANNGFSVGDVIPWECLWGQNYRNSAFWYNSTALGFGTSDQITTNNRGTAGTGVSIHSYIRMVFDFYKVRE